MEDILTKNLQKAPELVTIIIIVIAFLKFLKVMMSMNQKTAEQFTTAVQEIHKENLTAREQSRHVIEENTRAAGMNTAAMEQMTAALRNGVKAR